MARISKTVKLKKYLDAAREVANCNIQECVGKSEFTIAAIYQKHLDEIEAMNFIENIKPIKYNLIIEKDTDIKHYGYIAQDLKEYVDLLNFSEKDNFPKEEEDDIENVSLSVDYSKVCVLLHKGLKNALDRINKLEKFISELNIIEE